MNLEAQEIVPIVCIQTNRAANNQSALVGGDFFPFTFPALAFQVGFAPCETSREPHFFFFLSFSPSSFVLVSGSPAESCSPLGSMMDTLIPHKGEKSGPVVARHMHSAMRLECSPH